MSILQEGRFECYFKVTNQCVKIFIEFKIIMFSFYKDFVPLLQLFLDQYVTHVTAGVMLEALFIFQNEGSKQVTQYVSSWTWQPDKMLLTGTSLRLIASARPLSSYAFLLAVFETSRQQAFALIPFENLVISRKLHHFTEFQPALQCLKNVF